MADAVTTQHQRLIDRLLVDSQDHDALVELDKTLGREIRTYLSARADSDPSLVQDAYQDALVRFLELFQNPPDHPVEPGYLVAIAKNCLIDHIRKNHAEHPLGELLSEMTPYAGNPEDEWNTRIHLLQAVNRLDDRCRYVLESFYLEGLPAGDLAATLEVSTDSVYVLLQRCRERLRRHL